MARSRGIGEFALACSMASRAATTARRSVRDKRLVRGSSFETSAAMSVGKVSPMNRVSFAMPARDSTIDRQTSALFRPIEQIRPMPVTAIRVSRSGLRTGEIEPSPHHFYSIHASRSAEAKRTAEVGVQFHGDLHDVTRLDRAQHFAAIDAREESLALENQTAGELRHRLDDHHFRVERVVRRAKVNALDRALIDPPSGARRAKGNLMRETREPGHVESRHSCLRRVNDEQTGVSALHRWPTSQPRASAPRTPRAWRSI